MFFELETDYALNATSTRFGHIEMKILYIRMNFSKMSSCLVWAC